MHKLYLLFLLFTFTATATDEVVVLGKVISEDNRYTEEGIEYRYIVEIDHQYLGEKYHLPLIDVRKAMDINQTPFVFKRDSKALFYLQKKGEHYLLNSFSRKSDEYSYDQSYETAFRYIFIDQLSETLNIQNEKHHFVNSGYLEFMIKRKNNTSVVQFQRVAVEPYFYSAVSFYVESALENLSDSYIFEKQQNFSLKVVSGLIIIQPKNLTVHKSSIPDL